MTDTSGLSGPFELWTEAVEYSIDAWQRWVLTMDTLRRRGNTMLDHAAQGMPPLLAFPYEVLLDGRTLERPVNYALLRIVPPEGWKAKPGAPPVVVFDPRAGHGPGIGGFKEDSEVGIALEEGHHTYFVSFFPHPCPGQTLSDVERLEARFMEVVFNRHPGLPRPVVYGNCQAGWAIAMLGADRPDVTGVIVMNGAPMSYWAGAPGVNPMRVNGALSGGAWGASFLSDLGAGELDGAWLVQNFERLNPGNTFFGKLWSLYDQVDSERERFLRFETWWTGFYFLGEREAEWIVGDLFVGNKLEKGLLELGPGHHIDLRKINDPMIIFASSGDNITPPHQALNWIWEVYGSTEALKANGQRIVYLINPHVGHLGIFVSARIAQKEHRAIIESLDRVSALAPGIYEMKIVGPTGETDPAKDQWNVAFEERKVEDVCFPYSREEFERTLAMSEMTTAAYESFVSPWIRAAVNPLAAEWLRWLHPARASRAVWSDRVSPAMANLDGLAKTVGATRRPVSDDNTFRRLERTNAQVIRQSFDAWTETRDSLAEALFSWL